MPVNASQQPEAPTEPPRRTLIAFGPVKAKNLLTELARALAEAGVEPHYPETHFLSPALRASLATKLLVGRPSLD